MHELEGGELMVKKIAFFIADAMFRPTILRFALALLLFSYFVNELLYLLQALLQKKVQVAALLLVFLLFDGTLFYLALNWDGLREQLKPD
jgi:uncharacterized membrane protein YfhO